MKKLMIILALTGLLCPELIAQLSNAKSIITGFHTGGPERDRPQYANSLNMMSSILSLEGQLLVGKIKAAEHTSKTGQMLKPEAPLPAIPYIIPSRYENIQKIVNNKNTPDNVPVWEALKIKKRF